LRGVHSNVRFPTIPGIRSRLIRYQTHAGHAGLGLLKLRDINLDDLEATAAQTFGGPRISGREYKAVAEPEAVCSGGLAVVHGHGDYFVELRWIDGIAIVEKDEISVSIPARGRRSCLQMQAIRQLGLHDFKANRADEVAKRRDSCPIRSRRQADVERVSNAEHVAAVHMAVAHAVQYEMVFQTRSS